MNLIYNNQTFSSGGSVKITDYLEDPVEITNYSHSQLTSLLANPQYLMFADIYYGETKYIGYILKDNTTYPYNDIYLAGCPMYVSYESKSGKTSIYLYAKKITLLSDRTLYFSSSRIFLSSSEYHSTVTYNSSMYGKIWIGKYKQQITE